MMHTRLLLLAALIALLVDAAIALAPERSNAGAAASCDPARPHDAGDFNETIDSGGLTREYLLHIPPAYNGTDPLPLVLNLHGLGGNAHQQANYTGLPAKADVEGFITVAPLGTASGSFAIPHWNFTMLEQFVDDSVPNDVAFLNDLLDALETQLCIDTARVYSTGMSNGAMMSVRLACELSHRIAAIAPVAGVYYPPWSPDLQAEPPCNATRPIPIVAFHGTSDPIVPYQGGALGLEGLDFDTRHVENEVLPDWAAHNGCDPTPVASQVSASVRLIEFSNCDGGADVRLYAVEGGGHTWPDSATALPESIVGPTTHEINATDLLWAFFESHALAAEQAPAPTATAVVPGPTATVGGLPSTGGKDDGETNVALWVGVAIGVVGALGGAAVLTRRFFVRR